MSLIHLVRTIADIGMKPTVTKRDSLTIARRLVRLFCERREEIRHERNELRRTAVEMRHFLPFTKKAVADMEQQARDHRAAELEAIRVVLVGNGRLILTDSEGYAEALGFDALCDLLNVNVVDREKARREGWTTLRELVSLRDLENSAERRSDEWGAGSPLYQACHLALVEFIRTCPEHLLPDPFAPGGPLYGAPVRMVNPDGTMTIKRPDLTVHDASGSRVVKR